MNGIVIVPIASRLGTFTATFGDKGLVSLTFPGRGGMVESGIPTDEQESWIHTTADALEAVLTGRRPWRLPPLVLASGTPFQQAVWRVLQGIPPGETRSYGDVASEVGSPGAGRAVGRACGANPIPVLIPCHRVLGAGKQLGGFSAGLMWKRRLLAIEIESRR